MNIKIIDGQLTVRMHKLFYEPPACCTSSDVRSPEEMRVQGARDVCQCW